MSKMRIKYGNLDKMKQKKGEKKADKKEKSNRHRKKIVFVGQFLAPLIDITTRLS